MWCVLMSGEGDVHDWVSEEYSTDAYRETYAEPLYLLSVDNLTADATVVAPAFHRPKGRPRTKRFRRGEWGTKMRKCGRCLKMTTHNKRMCRVLFENLPRSQDEGAEEGGDGVYEEIDIDLQMQEEMEHRNLRENYCDHRESLCYSFSYSSPNPRSIGSPQRTRFVLQPLEFVLPPP